MTYIFNKKPMALAISCALALSIVSGVVRAQSNPLETNPADTGYLTDQRGTVARSGYGLCWHTGFGPPPASPNECDAGAAPAPLAQLTEPAKPLAAAPAAPVPAPKPAAEKVTLDADMLFDFDKAVLRPAGRAALDDFVAKTRTIEPEVIMAVGHADRFGSEAYNQRLSERRVAAVRVYLLDKGIQPNRIHAEGRGETQPITKAGECAGAKSAKVIACLQPDRRVEVEVVGTKIVK